MIDRAAIEKAMRDEAFGCDVWITFYLRGDPKGHSAMDPSLVELKAESLGSGESGVVYAKVPVSLDQGAIEKRISHVRELASRAEIEIDIIDLDASSDVENFKFYTLWTASAE